MSITIVVGGQYGGEGKGKVTYEIAKANDINIAVRVGGTNSGHTVVDKNNRNIILRQLPTPSILTNNISMLCAGSYIDIDVLMKEIEITGIRQDQLYIDHNAMIITQEDIDKESKSVLRGTIGSTLSGTGSSVARRIVRDKTTKLAKDYAILKPYIKDTKEFLNEKIGQKEKIIIEGTQGFGLSLIHSEHYPFTTSRDTTAASFLAEVGLSPMDVSDIVLVFRAFPIRVEGNSGVLKDEISWEELGQAAELSSVTRKRRRVARFDTEIAKKAIISNRPTKIVLNHLDYIKREDREEFIQNIEKEIGQRFDYYGLDNRCLVKTI